MYLEADLIRVPIKESFMGEFAQITSDMRKGNIVKVRELRSYTGQANHVAGLLYAWRPFLDALWAALAQNPAKGDTRSQLFYLAKAS